MRQRENLNHLGAWGIVIAVASVFIGLDLVISNLRPAEKLATFWPLYLMGVALLLIAVWLGWGGRSEPQAHRINLIEFKNPALLPEPAETPDCCSLWPRLAPLFDWFTAIVDGEPWAVSPHLMAIGPDNESRLRYQVLHCPNCGADRRRVAVRGQTLFNAQFFN